MPTALEIRKRLIIATTLVARIVGSCSLTSANANSFPEGALYTCRPHIGLAAVVERGAKRPAPQEQAVRKAAFPTVPEENSSD